MMSQHSAGSPEALSLAGRTLLHYRILEKIGEGGMGAVYKAQDTHLDRLVAIKVLPHDKMDDPERKQRFVQEAKSASSLNHPNIVVVHDIVTDRGLDFIVMEYVDGRTLDELIGRRGLKLGEALGYAAQIADGLAKAHAAGIVHRDLKPTNVMVTADGRVKILDFGLAKLVESVPAGDFGPTATLGRPEKPQTEEGFILGTVAYMSPEQAEGKKVDSRSDVFSFGSVLYEMLTGQKAFHRESRIATLASILNDEPKPAVQFNETLPPEVEQLLARCLRKDPQRRWQTMSDLKVVLQDLKDDSESGKLRLPAEKASRRRMFPLAWIGSGLGLIAAAAVLWMILARPAGPVEYEITRLTYDSGLTWAPAVSPDGKMFAYSSDRSGEGHLDIWVQQLAGGPPLRLTTHPSDDTAPAFSHDGAKIVFRSEREGGGIYEVATLGGAERRIADRGFLPAFSPDGAWISCVDVPASLDERLIKMLLIPDQGGTPTVFQPDFCTTGVGTGSSPVWSPDGKHLIFNGWRPDEPASLDWWVAPVEGGQAVRTDAHRNLPLSSSWQAPNAWADDHVYYATGSTVEGVNLFRTAIDPKSWRVRGPAEQITSGAGMQYRASVLPDGRIIYGHLNWLVKIWTIEADPDQGLIGGEPVSVFQDVTAKFDLSLSRDGSKLACISFGGSRQKTPFEIRLKDLRNGEERAFPTRSLQFGLTPRVSPDGSALAYRDFIEGKPKTYIVTGNETSGREVCDSCLIVGFYSDPRFALLLENGVRLARLNTASGEKTTVFEARDGRISEPALSPDDRWVAFVLGKPDGRVALHIAPLGGEPASGGDSVALFEEDRYLGSPAWSPGGEMLYYLSERDGFCCVWVQKLDPLSKKPVGDSQGVYHAHQSRILLNYPPGNGTVAVAKDKLVLWAGEATGNIYVAAPKRR